MALVVGADRGENERGRLGRRVAAIENDEARAAIDECGIKLRAAGAVLAAEEIVRTGGRNRLQEIGDRGEARGRGGRRRALFVERAVPEKGELGAVEGEVVDLAVVELVGADHLGRREKATTACAEPAIRGERGMLGEPSGDRRGRDGMPVAR